MLREKRCITSPNQIQFNSTVLFILLDWLWSGKAAKVSCTGFCSKATEVHSPTLWTESEWGSFSHTEQCTSLFTENFGILTGAFHALNKLDPESLYTHWQRNCISTLQIRTFRKHSRKTNPRRQWMFIAKRYISNKFKPDSFVSQQCTSIYRTGCEQAKRLKCVALDFLLKHPNCILP